MLFYLKNENIKLNNIKGVAAKRENALHKMGIFSIYELLMYFPKSYEYRDEIISAEHIKKSQTGGMIIKVISAPKIRYLKNKKNIATIDIISGGLKGAIKLFNASYAAAKFERGKEYYVYGRISADNKGFYIANPKTVCEAENMESIMKIYPKYALAKDAGISQNIMNNILKQAVNICSDEIEDVFDDETRKRFNIIDIRQAIINMHFPENKKIIECARNRIAFDELFSFLLYMTVNKEKITKQKNNYIVKNVIFDDFIKQIDFHLTKAQKKAIGDIIIDMSKESHVMNRLLQGDVGSGKTITAFFALINTAKNNFQSMLIAPTEILAKQHYENILKLTKKFNTEAVCLTSSSNNREEIKKILEEQKGIIAIGTHALFSKDIKYRNLALVVTDEQHKFGVAQRAKAANKGKNPHILMMSATPIPRTLSMVMYSNLDVSIIDEMPPGRKEIKTYCTNYSNKTRLYNYIKQKTDLGQQCYIVCASIDEAEDENIVSVKVQYDELKKYLKNEKIAYITGNMSNREKDEIYGKFINNEISILIATTVIEVGVDVKNANLIVVNNAERFGLSQLHQIRGRVGRGEEKGECILITDNSNEIVAKRMEIIKGCTDGFEIAQQDLYLRGPGEIFGYKQHGMYNFKYADIYNKPEIIYDAKKAVDMIYYNKKYDDIVRKILKILANYQKSTLY